SAPAPAGFLLWRRPGQELPGRFLQERLFLWAEGLFCSLWHIYVPLSDTLRPEKKLPLPPPGCGQRNPGSYLDKRLFPLFLSVQEEEDEVPQPLPLSQRPHKYDKSRGSDKHHRYFSLFSPVLHRLPGSG